MNRSYRIWYALLLLAALLPAGARLLLWWNDTPQGVDPVLAQAGEVLFKHEWQPKDPLSPEGDGLGPVFNASSCVACHHQGGVGGSGGLQHNVTTFTVRLDGQAPREGVVHAHHINGSAFEETLQHVDRALPALSRPTLQQLAAFGDANPLPLWANACLGDRGQGVHLSQRNTPALFGARLIDRIPERVILAEAKRQKKRGGSRQDNEAVVFGLDKGMGEDLDPIGRPARLADGRIGRFGWKAQMASLSDFVQAACANELGLGNPGQAQPAHLLLAKNTPPPGLDLTQLQCDQLTAFCASLPRPVEALPIDVSAEKAAAGRQLFGKIGCADCHTPKLGKVTDIYSDLLLHDMGRQLVGGGSYGEKPRSTPDGPDEGPLPSEWRTPPLWGVADSAPYLHDGRAATLEEAIKMHAGQGNRSARGFEALLPYQQGQLIAFLKTLRAP